MPRQRLINNLVYFAVALVSFQAGFIFCMYSVHFEAGQASACPDDIVNNGGAYTNNIDGSARQHQDPFDCSLCKACDNEVMASSPIQGQSNSENATQNKAFGKSMNGFLVGASRTSKKDLLNLYETGMPTSGGLGDNNGAGEDEALILYGRALSLPSGYDSDGAINGQFPLLQADHATANCDGLNILMTSNNNMNQCVAIVGNHNTRINGHVQRWVRNKEKGRQVSTAIDNKHDLRLVGRGLNTQNGVDDFYPPNWAHTKQNWKFLKAFIDASEEIYDALKPILQKIQRQNTVVVMTTNAGHASLLMNFVCVSRAKGIDLGNMIVFATDEDAKKTAEDLGLATFYDERIFGFIPSAAAKDYGNGQYSLIMYAKVLAPHLVNVLGYDLLFTDIDIVWNEDPLQIFQDKSHSFANFDILLQDDGSRVPRFSPYFGNSGFYFARHNDKTRYFFISMVYHADYIFFMHSHQQLMSLLLPEMSSLYGLRVKTLHDFNYPGGFHYLRKHQFLRDLINGSTQVPIFHWHWTASIVDKLKYMKQMGMWFVHDACYSGGEVVGTTAGGHSCCSIDPLVTCSYYDLPSVEQCKDSATTMTRKTEDSRRFWK